MVVKSIILTLTSLSKVGSTTMHRTGALRLSTRIAADSGNGCFHLRNDYWLSGKLLEAKGSLAMKLDAV